MLKTMAVTAAMAAALCMAAPAHAQIDWAEDLAETRRVLEEEHPDFFSRVDRAAFGATYDALARDLGGLSDRDVVARLAELVAMGRDGHTRLTLPVAQQAGLFATHRSTDPPRVPLFGQYPLRLRRAADGYAVVRSAPELSHLLGARLVSISGVSAEMIEERLAPVVHGDNLHQKQDLMPSFMVIPEILTARGVIRSGEQAMWRFRLSDGRERTMSLGRRASDEAIQWRFAPGEAPEEAPQSMTRTDGVLVVRIAEVVERSPGGFAQFCQALEQALTEEPPDALLIDLRGNFGGDNSLIDPLVRLLVRDRSLWAPGRLFVAIDGGTFSAAISLAAALEHWTPAVFVGSPTGGAPNHHGDARRFILPASGLTLRVSSLYWQMTSPTDARDALVPLVEAQPRIEDVRTGADRALSFVRASTRGAPAQTSGNWRGRVALGEHQLGMQITIADTVTMAIPDAGFPAATLSDVRTGSATLEASGEVAGYPAVVRARFTEAGMLGHVELLGNFHPFVAERVAN